MRYKYNEHVGSKMPVRSHTAVIHEAQNNYEKKAMLKEWNTHDL